MSKELDQHDAAAWSQRQRKRTPRKKTAPANQILDECSAHLAREYWEQSMRVATRMNPDAITIGWDALSEADRGYQIVTMRSMLYRGIIACTKTGHRIKFSLRERV